MTAEGRVEPDKVAYRMAAPEELQRGEHCGGCVFFQYDILKRGTHTCEVVTGPIEFEGWCRLYRPSVARENPDEDMEHSTDEQGRYMGLSKRQQPGIFDPGDVEDKPMGARTVHEIHERTVNPMEVIGDLEELAARLEGIEDEMEHRLHEEYSEEEKATPANPIDYHTGSRQPHNSLFASLDRLSRGLLWTENITRGTGKLWE